MVIGLPDCNLRFACMHRDAPPSVRRNLTPTLRQARRQRRCGQSCILIYPILRAWSRQAVSGATWQARHRSGGMPKYAFDLTRRKGATSHEQLSSIVAIAAAAALALPSLATAQQPHPAGLGDLMTAFVQPRHIKLGLAGSERNWPYAAYELDELRETFDDVAEIMPKYRDLSIPDMITSTVKKPLAALDWAIKAKDAVQFAAADGQLTASCNACQLSYDRAMIVIQPPMVAAFPDQDFRPPTTR
jgi:hypothetical protein